MCGKEFITNVTVKKCCSEECSRKNKSQLNTTYERNYRRVRRKKTVKATESVVDIAVKAKACGMSYGQYVAQVLGG